ncbi:hypothetical protein [Bartonella sp. DGB1]|uniref:hypothetical protein n=1 Tax=Bartonella sp. DGB1 TaxID=3239807 RepID=UPI0035252CAD
MSDLHQECKDILQNNKLSKQQKIEKLKNLAYTAESHQRAASESNMEPSDGWQANLRLIELAIEELEGKI